MDNLDRLPPLAGTGRYVLVLEGVAPTGTLQDSGDNIPAAVDDGDYHGVPAGHIRLGEGGPLLHKQPEGHVVWGLGPNLTTMSCPLMAARCRGVTWKGNVEKNLHKSDLILLYFCPLGQWENLPINQINHGNEL